MRSICSYLLRRVQSILLWLLLLLPVLVYAQNTLNETLNDYLLAQTQGLPGKVTFTVSPLDSRTRLSACEAFEPFLPSGSKLWGKATVGVRCLGPANWTIYVPVQINVSGNYLVSARPMTAGYVVGESDVVVRSGDLGSLPTNVLTDPSQAVGKTVKSGFSAGQPLRSDQLIAPWAVQQGQSVKTISTGPGFTVSSVGKALTNAVAGQVVQVRTDSGQVVSGIARPGGIVDIAH